MRRLFSREPNPPPPIVVVSGLPRSGTSMMMKMLEQGGLPVMTDQIREPDEDNPRGYFEFERVKQLDKGDQHWLGDAQGKVIKVISALLEHLPPEFGYRVIFMERQMDEVLASQRKMLARRGEPTDRVDDQEMARLFAGHLERVRAWLAGQPNFAVLYVDYNQLMADPLPYLRQVNQFLDNTLDEVAMHRAIDPALYRNRAT